MVGDTRRARADGDTHIEPMDEARQPAREPQVHPEANIGENLFDPIVSGDATKVVRHCERTPTE